MELSEKPMPQPVWSTRRGRFEATLPDGLTLVSWEVGPAQVIEGAIDQPHIVAQFPPGQHWVTVNAQDSAGKAWMMELPVNVLGELSGEETSL